MAITRKTPLSLRSYLEGYDDATDDATQRYDAGRAVTYAVAYDEGYEAGRDHGDGDDKGNDDMRNETMAYKDFIARLQARSSYADWCVTDGGLIRIACDEDPRAATEDPIAAVCNDVLGTNYNSGDAEVAAFRLGLSFEDHKAIRDAADGAYGEVREDLLAALGLGGADTNYEEYLAFADIFGCALANAATADIRAALSDVVSETAYEMGASNARFDRTRFEDRVLAAERQTAERLTKNQGERR